MALTQSQIARAWGPGCYHGPKLAIRLYGFGTVTVRPAIGDAVLALDACLRTAGYETDRGDTGAYVCRKKVGSNSVSNHSFGTALDINWDENPYGRKLITNMPATMRNAIKAIRTGNGKQVWGWGGDWRGNKDAMHWEIVCTPGDIASGIVGRTVAQMPRPLTPPVATKTTPVPVANPPAPIEEELPMEFISPDGVGGQYLVNTDGNGVSVVPLVSAQAAKAVSSSGVPTVDLGKDGFAAFYERASRQGKA